MHALFTNPWFYTIALMTIGGGRWLLQQVVKNAVDHRFALRIESHKSDLQRLAEQERFALQRKLAATGLYLEKQHSAAAEIYRAVRVAHGAIANLFGAQRSLILDDCNREDVATLLEQFDVLQGKRAELLELWEADRAKAAEAIKKHLFDLRLPRAENKLQEARNLMYLNEIYFADATIEAFDAFVAKCNEWIARSAFPPERGEKVKMVSRDELNASLERVQSTLRAELSDPASPSVLPTPE